MSASEDFPRRLVVCESCKGGGSPEAPHTGLLILDRPAKDQAELDVIMARHEAAMHASRE